MLGRVRLKEDNTMDEELPTLLECVFKYLAKNLHIVCDVNPVTQQLDVLKEDIIIPNEICDR